MTTQKLLDCLRVLDRAWVKTELQLDTAEREIEILEAASKTDRPRVAALHHGILQAERGLRSQSRRLLVYAERLEKVNSEVVADPSR